MSLDIIVGRSLAFCVHPRAAWTRLPPVGRAILVGAYFAAGYGTVFALLLTL